MTAFVEGVHFGMPAADYHRIPAVSNSSLKWLGISPLDFWARCPWLNPDYEAQDRSESMVWGTALHDRIVEGREAFYERNAPALEPEDCPGALRTVEELKDALSDLGLKTSGRKADLIERLQDGDPMALIWDAEVELHAAAHAGKQMLPPRFIRQLEIAAAMVERHPDLRKAFTGGQPEVTICWIDAETAVPCKARLDYLKIGAIVDYKSFSNQAGMSIDKAIVRNLASYKYHQQAAMYVRATDQIAGLLAAGKVYGEHDPEWLAKVAGTPKQFLFVFQATGPAPVARGKLFPRGLVYDCGKITVRDAIAKYSECLDRFGTDPWVDDTPIQTFDDEEIPSYAVE